MVSANFCGSCGAPRLDAAAFCAECGSPFESSSARVETAVAIPAGWYDDPTGRSALRYWSGSDWTDYVSRRDGAVWSDPLQSAAGQPARAQDAAAATRVEIPAATPVQTPVKTPVQTRAVSSAATGASSVPTWLSARRVVGFLLVFATTSVASGLLRVVMFGADKARDSSSAAFLVLNSLLSFVVSFVVFWLLFRKRRGAASIRVTAVLLLLALSMAGGGPARAADKFDWSKKFSQPYYLVHIIETSTMSGPVTKDAWILSIEQPDDQGILLTADGYGGTFSNKTDDSLGPFRSAGDVCTAALGKGLKGSSWGVEGRYWNCDAYREYQRTVAGTGFFGLMGTILVGIGWSAGSVATGGLGLVCGAIAVRIWFRGAPGPIEVKATPLISRYIDFAKGEAVKLERSQLRGLSEEEAKDLGVILEHLSPEQKMRVGKDLGIEYQKLADALKDLKNLPPDYF